MAMQLGMTLLNLSKPINGFIDGNKISSLENRIEKSDTVLYLKFPIEFCKNSVNQRSNQNKINLGAPEQLSLSEEEFRQHCLKNLENWHKEKSIVIDNLEKKYAHKFITFTNRKQVDDFLHSMIKTL